MPTAVGATTRRASGVLIEAALQPGVSVARLAQEHGVNANLLRKWITKFLMEREQGILPIPHSGDDTASPDEVDGDHPPAGFA